MCVCVGGGSFVYVFLSLMFTTILRCGYCFLYLHTRKGSNAACPRSCTLEAAEVEFELRSIRIHSLVSCRLFHTKAPPLFLPTGFLILTETVFCVTCCEPSGPRKHEEGQLRQDGERRVKRRILVLPVPANAMLLLPSCPCKRSVM